MEPIVNKKSKNPVGKKSTTVNILLNASIFILFAVIIYMFYSIYIKIANRNTESEQNLSDQVAANMIQVDVLNGCGVNGVGDRFTDFLRTNGFDVVKIGNYVNNDLDESLIIDRTGNMANAYKVAKALGIKNQNVIQQLNKDYFLDVSIVIGRDYFNLTPFK